MNFTLLYVAAGGAIGASGRYLLGGAATRLFGSGFPFGTLLVNLLGSFLMGLAFVFLLGRGGETSRLVPFLMTGVLGGFTTFSAFSLDFWLLIERGRLVAGGLYIGGSIILSIAALILGITLARGISA